jgi:hypothetical protein
VVGVKTLLDRLDALDKEKDPGDKAALKILSARGLSADERARLRGLVQIAEKGTSIAPSGVEEVVDDKAAERQKTLTALRAWFEEWSEMARVAVKRRDRLMRLGLAKRRSPKKKAPPPDVQPPAS